MQESRVKTKNLQAKMQRLQFMMSSLPPSKPTSYSWVRLAKEGVIEQLMLATDPKVDWKAKQNIAG
jgi:hypothetical protein